MILGVRDVPGGSTSTIEAPKVRRRAAAAAPGTFWTRTNPGVHGNLERAAYDVHFESVCYHPPFCFDRFGNRPGI